MRYGSLFMLKPRALVPGQRILWISLGLYLVVEIKFFVLFRWYLVKRANQRTLPQPHRGCADQDERHHIIARFLDRANHFCEHTNQCFQTTVRTSIRAWFRPIHTSTGSKGRQSSPSEVPTEIRVHNILKALPPLLRRGDTVSTVPTSSSNHSDSTICSEDSAASTCLDAEEEHPQIGKVDAQEFLAWGLFEKELLELTDWEWSEIQKSLDLLEERAGLVFPEGRSTYWRPCRLSIDKGGAIHRPLLFYLLSHGLGCLSGMVLRLAGFRKVTSRSTGLVGWYRPAATTNVNHKLQPLLFFHGIAPGGLWLYLPMTLFGLANDGRAAFLFENPSISTRIGFQVLREADTVKGVQEIIDAHVPHETKLTLCGHSFGSAPLTWLLHDAAFRDRIQQLVLLDPITILLSEPDVLSNFLYQECTSPLIRYFARTELFTEHYLRRHFSGYNRFVF